MRDVLFAFGGGFIGMAFGGAIATPGGPLSSLPIDVAVAVFIGGVVIVIAQKVKK